MKHTNGHNSLKVQNSYVYIKA